MDDRAALETALARTIERYGEWVFDIPLPHGLWTRADDRYPHTRLRRVIQIMEDASRKPLSECRIVDLGCLDGLFSLELALHGAEVLGIEVREANFQRAIFVKQAYGLSKLNFVRDDVRNFSKEKYGAFDIVLCSGILYHLPAPDVFRFLENIYDSVADEVIIDTHVSLTPTHSIECGGHSYHGQLIEEHDPADPPAVIEARTLNSADAKPSFMFTRPSLINFLSKIGFSSIYECFNPAHLNYGKPGLEHNNRCTFLAIKGHRCHIYASPIAETLRESWPEGSLTY